MRCRAFAGANEIASISSSARGRSFLIPAKRPPFAIEASDRSTLCRLPPRRGGIYHPDSAGRLNSISDLGPSGASTPRVLLIPAADAVACATNFIQLGPNSTRFVTLASCLAAVDGYLRTLAEISLRDIVDGVPTSTACPTSCPGSCRAEWYANTLYGSGRYGWLVHAAADRVRRER